MTVSDQTVWFKPSKHIDQEQHAVVIGGGIAGSQAAWHLAERGWQVTLIERHSQLATEASGNKLGAISPKMTAQASLGEDFYSACFTYIYQQLHILRQRAYSFNWDACGVLQLNHNERETKRWRQLQQRGFPADFLQCIDASQASEIAGIPLTMGGSYFPSGGWVEPSSLCNALCSHKNVQVVYHKEALQLEYIGHKWSISDQSEQIIARSNTVIIANGKDLQQFKQTQHLPMQLVLGQTSEAVSSTYSHRLKTVIGHEGYLTPAVDGVHVFGATFERNTVEVKLTETANTTNFLQLQKHLKIFASQLGSVQSSHAAIRVTTPDRFPYVGAVPDRDYYQTHYADIGQGKHWKVYPDAQYQAGLFVFAGHASRGITTTGLCADYLAAIICNEAFEGFSEKIKEALHLARFDIRGLKRVKSSLI